MRGGRAKLLTALNFENSCIYQSLTILCSEVCVPGNPLQPSVICSTTMLQGQSEGLDLEKFQ